MSSVGRTMSTVYREILIGAANETKATRQNRLVAARTTARYSSVAVPRKRFSYP